MRVIVWLSSQAPWGSFIYTDEKFWAAAEDYEFEIEPALSQALRDLAQAVADSPYASEINRKLAQAATE